jgi:hypothetical protein
MQTLKRKVAILYHPSPDGAFYETAVEIAAREWDAGSSVRVRRASAETPFNSDDPEVPVAAPEDVEWATVTLVIAA